MKPADFLAGGGEAGAYMRGLDWSRSPLGPPDTWSPTLKQTVSLILPSAAQIVIFWGPKFCALYNDAYAPAIGQNHPHAIGQPASIYWAELWHDIEPLFERARSGETVFAKDRPFQVERKGFPEEVFFDISYSPVRNESGEVEGIICIVAETTDRVLSQRQLAAERERLADMFRQTPSFMAQVEGPEHVFTFANESYMKLIGRAEAIIGKPVRAALPELQGQGFFELLDKVYTSGQPFVGRGLSVKLERDHDQPLEEVFLDFIYQPIKKEGQVTGIFVEGYDVTENYRATRALAESEAELERRLEERTRELMVAEENLRQSQKMEALGQLTGGIAHDFNNLLTGIIGSLDILRRRIASGRTQDLDKFMDAATASANRAAGLTQRLLAFSRRQSLDIRAVEIDKLTASMADLLRRTIGEQIELNITGTNDLWLAEGDPNQIESALLNFTINARDAMPHGGKLSIATRNERIDAEQANAKEGMSPGDYVAIAVADTGAGMTSDVLRRAVDPFFTTKPIGQGTGLGLSMAYGYAKQARGHLQIESEPGKGTVVTLYLPRSRAGSATEEVHEDKPLPSGSGETVLVVEDDPSVRLTVVEVLRDLGYEAIEAVDARSALPILESRQRIDLMVSDVGLPGMNGRQIAEIARASRPELQVLFITGYAENARVRGGFLGPGMEMITKPFAVDALATKIREMIAKDNAAA